MKSLAVKEVATAVLIGVWDFVESFVLPVAISATVASRAGAGWFVGAGGYMIAAALIKEAKS